MPKTNYHLWDDNPVYGLLTKKGAAVERAMAMFRFVKGENVQKLIHRFKYYGCKKAAWQIGAYMAIILNDCPAYRQVDFLIPVPLHKKKMRKRRYNQSEYLCRGISSIWGTPLDTETLIKRSATDTQTRKSIQERQQNVKGVFAVHDATRLAGKQILLVDDMVTSGSTLSACIEALCTIPGIRISVLTLGCVFP
jgi:ComF family protein